jgi:hypothetical protein
LDEALNRIERTILLKFGVAGARPIRGPPEVEFTLSALSIADLQLQKNTFFW